MILLHIIDDFVLQTNTLSKLKQKTVGRVGKYAKDVGNHQFKRFMGIK